MFLSYVQLKSVVVTWTIALFRFKLVGIVPFQTKHQSYFSPLDRHITAAGMENIR